MKIIKFEATYQSSASVYETKLNKNSVCSESAVKKINGLQNNLKVLQTSLNSFKCMIDVVVQTNRKTD